MSGITTMIGGGTGPATGTNATTCTPGPWNIMRMLQAADGFADELRLPRQGQREPARGRSRSRSKPAPSGLKLHEDWGTTPAAIDTCLSVAERYDVQVAIHTDTLERVRASSKTTLAAFKGRTIHTYHTEGAGGGHAPDIIKACGADNVLPSSTNPTRPFTVNTVDEHLDMLMVCHHLDPGHSRGRRVRRVAHSPRDHRRRGHPARPGRVLDDLVGLAGHGARRRGHHAHVADRAQDEGAARRAAGGHGARNDNFRAKRYVAKYTINPAITHGIAHARRLDRGRQARGPRAVAAGVLRRQAVADHQGRHDRRGADGRSERVDPHAAARALPADVRRVRPRASNARR